ncbi:MAG: hypothetical protein O2955_11830 [Planctomycetota bacterium]|nr:hypothetical protein [Planctomycetota bacterium]MDA1213200.1 hypothetical protein [Planctomycetota bacterium]
MIPLPLPILYRCPGEEHPITRSIHLARLAAFFPKCRDCEHRGETGQLPTQAVTQFESTRHRIERPSVFNAEGVRGVYLNELTCEKVGRIAGAFASVLWDDIPRHGQSNQDPFFHPPPFQPESYRRGPSIVVSLDNRPSSPEVARAVAASLRRMGCQVIDVGLATTPCFWFAVHHLDAAGGILITGAGEDPSWTGFEFVGRGAVPLSAGHGLEQIERRYREGYSRPTRQSFPQRSFEAWMPYLTGLWKHFHALRPLRVCCATPNELVRQSLEQLFEKLPCRLMWVPISRRRRQLGAISDPDTKIVGQAVRDKDADFGVLIDEDGQQIAFWNEQGLPVADEIVMRLLATFMLRDFPHLEVALESPGWAGLETQLASLHVRSHHAGTTRADMTNALSDPGTICGGGPSHRYWFREAYPTCDAILALAKMLQLLSLRDTKFSELMNPASSPR